MDEMDEEKRRLTEKGTIRIHSYEELDSVAETFKEKGLLTPGGAAGMLGVSRAYIHQLEKDKRIRAYRLKEEELDKKHLPLTWRLLLIRPRTEDYILIPVVDLEEYEEEMKQKGKGRVR